MIIFLYYLLLILFGYSFSIIFLPPKLKQYSLILSPWIGTVFIIYGGIALGMGRIAMNEELLTGIGFRGVHFLLFIVLLASIYLFVFIKERLLSGKKSHVLIIVFLLVCFIFFDGIPKQNQGDTFVKSKYLLDHAITDILDKNQKISTQELEVGSAMNVVFFQSLLKSNPEIFLSIITRLYLLLYLSLGVIFYDIYKNKKIKFVRIPIIVSYIGFLIYIVMNGITLQSLLTSAIFICCLLFFLSTLDKTPKIIDSVDIVLVLFLFVLFSIHPFLAVILSGIFILYYLYKTYNTHSLQYFYKIGIIILLLLLVNPLYFGLLFHVYL